MIFTRRKVILTLAGAFLLVILIGLFINIEKRQTATIKKLTPVEKVTNHRGLFNTPVQNTSPIVSGEVTTEEDKSSSDTTASQKEPAVNDEELLFKQLMQEEETINAMNLEKQDNFLEPLSNGSVEESELIAPPDVTFTLDNENPTIQMAPELEEKLIADAEFILNIAVNKPTENTNKKKFFTEKEIEQQTAVIELMEANSPTWVPASSNSDNNTSQFTKFDTSDFPEDIIIEDAPF